jgi:hypothetical protein
VDGERSAATSAAAAWDVAVVDLLNAISGRETKDIDESVARLAGVANDTGCHIIACQHLNRGRLTAHLPAGARAGRHPRLRRDADLATNVLSVYRHERDDAGEPTGEPGDEAVAREHAAPLGPSKRAGRTAHPERVGVVFAARPADHLRRRFGAAGVVLSRVKIAVTRVALESPNARSVRAIAATYCSCFHLPDLSCSAIPGRLSANRALRLERGVPL